MSNERWRLFDLDEMQEETYAKLLQLATLNKTTVEDVMLRIIEDIVLSHPEELWGMGLEGLPIPSDGSIPNE